MDSGTHSLGTFLWTLAGKNVCHGTTKCLKPCKETFEFIDIPFESKGFKFILSFYPFYIIVNRHSGRPAIRWGQRIPSELLGQSQS